jgi:hypothetical protein
MEKAGMENEFIIRTFETEDLKQVLNLHRVAMEEIGAYKGDGPWNDDLKEIDTHYLQNGGVFLVGVVGVSVAAMGAFRRLAVC